MNRSLSLSLAAVLLAAIAFLAGRASISKDAAAPDAAPKITSAPSTRSTVSSEPTKSFRPATPPDESAQALLDQLARLSATEGASRSMRPILMLLEQLDRLGPKALPPIHKFLLSGEDVAYAPAGGQRLRDVDAILKALVPPSLRIALFDIVAHSGGKDAEAILAENLTLARSGLEVACLSALLEQIAPGTYNDATVAAATAILSKGNTADRNLLFEIMRKLGDTSFVAKAQQQMIQPDGKVDRNAVNYLRQAMGEKSLALAARTYQDPRLTEPGAKEPLARLALSYVGANPQALELYHTALLDPSITPDQKHDLVEDLNQDGIIDRKNPTPDDLQVIAKRYELTQAYLQEPYVQGDKTLNAAFHEADKDLRNMLDRAAAAAATPAR
ncbi:hypothetical protein [Luteolibacter soli]|uniref:Uncharacterized protein n=1 Tax=Luteolibacter soli TaxID=3135280 RepID=A0ABU9AV10_9BACT